MLGRISNLKEKLYKELDTETLNKEKILKISKELDKLIVEYSNRNISGEFSSFNSRNSN